MHRGAASKRIGLPGIPAEAESEMVERDILAAERTGAALHLQHISSAHSVTLIRNARARGVNVTAEVTPHHLAFTDEDAAAAVRLPGGGGNFKMNPPLRSESDRPSCSGAGDGALGIIATDHAPHTKQAKAAGFHAAPFGVIGMETAAAAVWTHLVLKGILTVAQMVERMSVAPAAASASTPARCSSPGPRGDVMVLDPTRRPGRSNPESFRSRSRNCPFAGQRLHGRVAATIVGGVVRYHVTLLRRRLQRGVQGRLRQEADRNGGEKAAGAAREVQVRASERIVRSSTAGRRRRTCPRFQRVRGMEIFFSDARSDADTDIKTAVSHDAEPRSVRVITSDGAIRRFVERYGATVTDSGAFLQEVRDALANSLPEDEPIEKYEGAAGEDADYWMRVFGDEEEDGE